MARVRKLMPLPAPWWLIVTVGFMAGYVGSALISWLAC